MNEALVGDKGLRFTKQAQPWKGRSVICKHLRASVCLDKLKVRIDREKSETPAVQIISHLASLYSYIQLVVLGIKISSRQLVL